MSSPWPRRILSYCACVPTYASRTRATTARRSPPHLRTSAPRAQSDEKLVQLRECFAHRIRRAACCVEGFLRGIKLVHDQQRLAALFRERHRRDGALVTFLVGPDEARVWGHFLVRAEERRVRVSVCELQAVSAADANVHFAGKEGHSHRLRNPPSLEQVGPGPRFEHDARRR